MYVLSSMLVGRRVYANTPLGLLSVQNSVDEFRYVGQSNYFTYLPRICPYLTSGKLANGIHARGCPW